jgi:ribosome-associated toxin RatA of RatAB toxin-antitoxin module
MTTRVQRSEWVPYTAEQMFHLVNDVESYPEFLPHCRSARILESRDGTDQGHDRTGQGGAAQVVHHR